MHLLKVRADGGCASSDCGAAQRPSGFAARRGDCLPTRGLQWPGYGTCLRACMASRDPLVLCTMRPLTGIQLEWAVLMAGGAHQGLCCAHLVCRATVTSLQRRGLLLGHPARLLGPFPRYSAAQDLTKHIGSISPIFWFSTTCHTSSADNVRHQPVGALPALLVEQVLQCSGAEAPQHQLRPPVQELMLGHPGQVPSES
jgi:hypothetical protein